MGLSSVEVCAGAGGQALGLEWAGFAHEALIELEREFCATLRHNRPAWNVHESDLSGFDGRPQRALICSRAVFHVRLFPCGEATRRG